MILFFQAPNQVIFVVHSLEQPDNNSIEKLCWLFGGATAIDEPSIVGWFKGPRKEMLTPWSTNAVEITQNMGIDSILRIEQFFPVDEDSEYDPMLEIKYQGLDQEVYKIERLPEPVIEINDISTYNDREGLALSKEEVDYLEDISKRIGRKLTDSEVFGFSQVNSEHCRHKIFNGTFIIDGQEKEESLFRMIKNTSSEHPNRLISAYKDNVAFMEGPEIEQFAPGRQDVAEYFETSNIKSVISLKAETHNFPTTVEPFNGAATGSGGEIRDRMAGGSGSIPLAGTAVYMTSYPRLGGKRKWEKSNPERNWLYQTPIEILIKASNGASDYGNKFGQPLIAGSLLTFEHFEDTYSYGYDKVIMLAGGIGFGKMADSLKGQPQTGDKIVVLGGDNYRIGMGGGAVSSVATGEYGNSIELNAIQRSNPEMQKRVYNAIRAMSELSENPIVSIHDHGAGGHLNCLSELVEYTGGNIEINKLPVGDPTLSSKEIIGNESQERMGLVLKKEDISLMKNVAERERAPMYVVGEVTGDNNFRFKDKNGNQNPIDLELEYLFGSSPKTILKDKSISVRYSNVEYEVNDIEDSIVEILQMEAVACKDWLTNKVDRSVTGKVAMQQCTGPLQLPLNNLGVMALDYQGEKGVATAIGHAPVSALIDPEAGSKLSIAEALTNIIWAPIEQGIRGVSLSANWMWPAKNSGEDARLYNAVKATSDFAIQLGLNIPTGKDSLSMTQKYPNGDVVYSPGTVIISAGGEVTDIKKVVTPVIKDDDNSSLWYIDLSNDDYKLGGSSFAQTKNAIGTSAPTINDASYFANVFNVIQGFILKGKVLAGHDISAGGMITALLEMTFPRTDIGLNVNLKDIEEADLTKIIFSENPGIILQLESEDTGEELNTKGVNAIKIGEISSERTLRIRGKEKDLDLNIDEMRDHWFKTSFLLDEVQTAPDHARRRFENYKKQALRYKFNPSFDGKLTTYGLEKSRKTRSGIKAAIIREKGVNGDREMAYSMHLAGFDVKDVHMTDLISGREDLKDINFIVFVGGFSNSDVLGSAKGWAGAFLYNEKAKKALDSFYKRPDTLSLGVCNGCQLMMELGLIYPEDQKHPKMLHNTSGKFESNFLNVTIEKNETVMFKSLSGNRLGAWVAHGEGKFSFPGDKSHYNIIGVFSNHAYPGNPNGSDYDAAIIASKDGRHVAMMPHLERSIFSWQWPWLSKNEVFDVSPWFESFVNAANWIKKNYNKLV
jgi:phosphoribosylformylglycinamidine synthase